MQTWIFKYGFDREWNEDDPSFNWHKDRRRDVDFTVRQGSPQAGDVVFLYFKDLGVIARGTVNSAVRPGNRAGLTAVGQAKTDEDLKEVALRIDEWTSSVGVDFRVPRGTNIPLSAVTAAQLQQAWSSHPNRVPAHP